MLRSLLIAGLLLVTGQAFADQSNALPSGETAHPAVASTPTEAFGSTYLGKWVVQSETGRQVFGDIWIGNINWYRDSSDFTHQHLYTEVNIPACDGTGGQCQWRFEFILGCVNSAGSTFEVYSPWIRNYRTNGTETRDYGFYDSRIADCDDISYINTAYTPGW